MHIGCCVHVMSPQAVEVGLHTVVLNKVISYLTADVQIDFPRVFHMWSCIQWSFGGNRDNRTERTACHPS
jgi:hypothetical protein